MIDWLVNRARPYLFSTASPAATSAAAVAALEMIAAEPWRRSELLAKATLLRERLTAQGWNVGQSQSQIIPIVVGASSRAVELSERLHHVGYWAPAIRPPSVPDGESRLRISLSYGHTDEMVQGLADAMEALG